MDGKIVNIESIGAIVFEKNNRIKNLRITVRPLKGVIVSYPRHVSFSNAYKFVEEKKDWIRKSLDKIKELETSHTVFKPGLEYTTRHHQLFFILKPEGDLTVKVGKGFINVFYTSEDQILTETGQAIIRKGVDFALRKEAKQILPERIQNLAFRNHMTFADLRLKNLKSRWGSCSSRNNINLNIHLVRLPDHLIDYVILHELAHTIEKNHGKGFWKLLEELSGNAKLLASEMKNYRTQIY